jgi:hypothetical protein
MKKGSNRHEEIPADIAVHFHLSDVVLAERFVCALSEISSAPGFEIQDVELAERYARALRIADCSLEIDVQMVELAERLVAALDRIAEHQDHTLTQVQIDKAMMVN